MTCFSKSRLFFILLEVVRGLLGPVSWFDHFTGFGNMVQRGLHIVPVIPAARQNLSGKLMFVVTLCEVGDCFSGLFGFCHFSTFKCRVGF